MFVRLIRRTVSANYTKRFATVQKETSSCSLAAAYEDILRMYFFPSLIERDPIHVKYVLKEEENVKSSFSELHNLTNEECGYDFESFLLLTMGKISLQAKE